MGDGGSGYGYRNGDGVGRGGFKGECIFCHRWGHRERHCPALRSGRGGRGDGGGHGGRGSEGDDWAAEPDLPWGYEPQPQQQQRQQQQFARLQYVKEL